VVAEQSLPNVAPGLTVGVSASHSEDLARFGVSETHVRMALAEVARAVLAADGRVVYGGHLDADGYTLFLTKEIERSGRRNRPFTGYIPFSVHRAMSTAQIAARIRQLSVLGSYVFLDADGNVTDPTADRDEDGAEVDAGTGQRALSAARRVIAGSVDGHTVIGGKRTGFQGRMPGVVEEAIYAIEATKPVFIAGGFGGSAADIATTLGLDPDGWLGVRIADAPHLQELQAAADAAGWSSVSNGLTAEENRRLAITYRASEIASLVVTGLSRLDRDT
jgi:hypothetical protein